MGTKGKGPKRPPPSTDQMAARLDRASTERMFFMGRAVAPVAADGDGDDDVDAGVLQPFVVTGVTGRVYTIHLSTEEAGSSKADVGGVGIVTRCNCPDFIFRRAACKHILFILLRVLNIPKERLLSALSSPSTPLTHSEVTAAAAASQSAAINPFYTPPKELADRLRAIAGDWSGTAGGASGAGRGGVPAAVPPRVPAPDDDCPICYEAFGEVTADDPGVVYCRRGCGGGVHTDCFRRWKDNASGPLTCVYCRAPWGLAPSVAATSGNVLDTSGGGRGRMIELENYMPDDPAAPRARGKAKKKGAAGGASKATPTAKTAGRSSKRAVPVDSESEPDSKPESEPESSSDADVKVVAASRSATVAKRRAKGNAKAGAPAKAKAPTKTDAPAKAKAPTKKEAPAPRLTRSGMATRTRRTSPQYVELSDEEDGDAFGGDASDASVAVDDDGADNASPQPTRSKRPRRR